MEYFLDISDFCSTYRKFLVSEDFDEFGLLLPIIMFNQNLCSGIKSISKERKSNDIGKKTSNEQRY